MNKFFDINVCEVNREPGAEGPGTRRRIFIDGMVEGSSFDIIRSTNPYYETEIRMLSPIYRPEYAQRNYATIFRGTEDECISMMEEISDFLISDNKRKTIRDFGTARTEEEAIEKRRAGYVYD